MYETKNVKLSNILDETVFENAITVFPITFQNKTKMPGENRTCLVYVLEVANYIYYIQVYFKELFRV